MSELEGRAERLSPERRALFERELARRAAVSTTSVEARAGPVPHGTDAAPAPLSFAQERFWFLQRLEPTSPEYGLTGGGWIAGAIDTDALERAFERLVERHAVLRTTFPERDGVPVQFVSASSRIPLPVLPLAGSTREACEREVAARARALARQPFDLECGPVLRVQLLRVRHSLHALLVSLHHIVADGLSMRVLLRDLGVFYRAEAPSTSRTAPLIPEGLLPETRRADPDLPPLRFEYADFAVWQRARFTGERLEQHVAAWRTLLEGAPQSLDLPIDHVRPALKRHDGATFSRRLSPEVTQAARSRARLDGTTVFCVLLAAVQGFLARVCRQDDVVVGTAWAGREREDVRNLIGPFVNTLALRARNTSTDTFRNLIARATQATRRAFAHAELPFEKLVAELSPPRDPSRTPLFDVFFDMAVDYSPPKSDDLQTEMIAFDHGNALFDLSIAVHDRGAQFEIALEYDIALFESATIERLWTSLSTYLTAALAEPERAHGTLPLCSAAEHELVRERFAFGRPAARAAGCVHERFAAAALRTPDACALECGHGAAVVYVSYAELAARVRRLARVLRERGVGPGVCVGVCVERSAETVVTALAIWEAGGVYVPLDPSEPSERLRRVLGDLGGPLVLASSDTAQALAAAGGRPLVLAELADELARADATPLEPLVGPNDLAYTIFTSGSTGKPKGVEVEHAALANNMDWSARAFAIAATDRFLLRTPTGFDASLWELVHPLAAGATLVVAPHGLERDPAQLLSFVADRRVSVVQSVPAMLSTWLDEPNFTRCSALRVVVCSGESLAPGLAARFFEQTRVAGTSARLLNLYGPTEAAIDATWHEVQADAPLGLARDSVPIGRPIDGAWVRVLDAQLAEVPIGVIGELCIGGAGLARGYLGDPATTRTRFVGSGAQRFYRTGDDARWLADGTLEFVGRSDGQVKIAGRRVELGEIEAALVEHPSLRSAAVAVDRRGGAARLVAFVVPRVGVAHAPSATDLRSFLALRLPGPLVPQAFAFLAALPLTTSEKVDRSRLPFERAETVAASDGAVPSDPLEAEIAGLAADLLSVPQVGSTDDFFALGGHSLLAVRLATRLRERFGVEVSLVAFFDAPNVATLARLVRAAPLANATPLVALPTDAPRPLSFSQERLYFLDRLDPGSRRYSIPVALRLEGPLDANALALAWRDLIDRHEVLRATFREVDGETRQVLLAPEALDLVEREAASEHELLRLVAAEVERPFDLARGPLVRATLVRCAADDHALVIVQHHAVSDGTSLRLIGRDVRELYSARRAERPAVLPALVAQYADAAAWERARATDAGLEFSSAHWRAALSGAPARLALPQDRQRPQNASDAGAHLLVELDAALTRAARHAAHERGTTLYAVLLAGFAGILQRITGADDVVIGAAVAQRPALELENVVGPFVNALPLRIDLSGAPCFDELALRTRRTLAGALAHAHVPFEQLVALLAPVRSTSHAPLFQVSFDLLDAREDLVGFERVQVREIQLAATTAKLDLAVAVEDYGDRLVLRVEYATELFDRATVARWIELYQRLLKEALATPRRAIDTLPSIADDEPRSLTFSAADDGNVLHQFEALPDVLARLAHEEPAALALIADGRSVARGALARRATDFAAAFAARGVVSGDLVALDLPRSVDFVAAMLATWHVGAAWMALDPRDPSARRSAITRAADVRLRVASESNGADDVPTLHCADVASTSSVPTRVAADERALAYVIATSGSTGVPKLVEIEHGALANHTAWAVAHFELCDGDRALQRLPFTFDAALLELLPVLAAGGACVLAPCEDDRDPAAIVRLAAREKVTVLAGVPAFVARMLEVPQWSELTTLRHVLVGGERMDPALVRAFRARSAHTSRSTPAPFLHNLYGPAEATIDALAHRCDGSESNDVPIGRPVAGACALLLDRTGAPVPDGLVGELVLAGPGLARGYRGDVAETARRFVSHPPGATNGRRVLRTGDLARVRKDGAFVFVGRTDAELKVRGRRVDPGEIERALVAHTDVRAAAVVSRPDGEGDTALVAFVEAARFDAHELARFLGTRLPAGLVPAPIVHVDALPRLAGGKLDRRALALLAAQVSAAPSEAPEPSAAPLHGLEADLARLFAQSLRRTRIGRDDDYFALGGTSLAALRMATRARETLGLELPLRALFAVPTVRGLAEVLSRGELGSKPLDRTREAALGPLVRPATTRVPRTPARVVLVTGASGFLGAHLAAALHARGVPRVLCLVRAQDLAQARARLDENGRRLELDLRNVEVVVGDLEADGLGIASDVRAELERELDLVVHAGARVDFVRDYQALAPANVGGTRSLVELCCASGGAHLHFVSTIGVAAAPDLKPSDVVREDDDLARFAGLEQGYEQSKWIAEAVVQGAMARGLPATIHRIGRLAADSRTGVGSPDDFATRTLRGVLALGAAPDTSARVDLTPVDAIADAIAAIALAGHAKGQTLHLVNPQRTAFADFVSHVRAVRDDLVVVPYSDWIDRARRAVHADPDHALAPVLPLLEPAPGERLDAAQFAPDELLPRLDTTNAKEALERVGVVLPVIDAASVARAVAALRRQASNPKTTP